MARDGNGPAGPWARQAAALAAVVAASALVAARGLGREIWLDEAATLRVVQSATGTEWRGAFASDSQLVAYPLLLTLWSVLSDAVPWLRALSLACSVATVAVGYRWAVRVGGSTTAGIVTALLLATSPFLLRYGVELRGYALLYLAATAAAFAAWRLGTDTSRRPVWTFILAASLAVSVHPTGVLLLPALAVIVVLSARAGSPPASWREGVGRVPWMAFGAAGALVLLHAVVKPPSTVVGGDWWMPSLSPDLVWRSFAELLGPGAILLAFVFALAWRSIRAWGPLAAGVLTCWIAVAAVSLVWTPIWWPRILGVVLPMLFVAAGIAVAALPVRLRTLALAAAVGVSAFGGWRWVAHDASRPVEPWRDALSHLTAAGPRAVAVAVPAYVDLVLRHGFALDASRLAGVAIGTAGDDLDVRLAPAIDAAAAGDPVTVVVRIDLTLAADPGLPVRVVERFLAQPSRQAPVAVVLVLGPDAPLRPDLFQAFEDAESRLTAAFGPPVRRETGDRWRRLTF